MPTGQRAAPPEPEASISATASVRSIIATHPQTRTVFQRHGLMNCGGALGPDEPLDFFARAHHVPFAALLRELEAAARGVSTVTARPSGGMAAEESARRFVPFLVAALGLTLTFGATLGMINLARLTAAWGWGTLSRPSVWAHAYVQVFGFVGLFVMGVAYHVIPRFTGAPLRAVQSVAVSFWLHLGGVLSVVIGFLLPERFTQPFWIAGSVALFAAMMLFARSITLTLRAGTSAPEPFERWILAGSGWGIVATALAVIAAISNDAIWHSILWPIALFGFAGCWIFGVGRRILPIFLGLRTRWCRLERPTFWLHQVGVAAWSAGAWPDPDPTLSWLRGIGAVALMASVTAYVGSLGLVGRRAAPGGGLDRGYERFVYAAWGWLFVGLAAGPLWTLGALARGSYGSVLMLDFARHAVAFGFVAQMIMGVASRVLPVFTGNQLWSPRARSLTFWLLNLAVAIRGLEAVVAAGFWPGAWPLIAFSGPPAVLAVCLFTANVLMTLFGNRAAAGYQPLSVPDIADTIVARLLEIPGALDLLADAGFAPLCSAAMRATFAQSVTLRQACRLKGIPLDPLVKRLRQLYAATHQPPATANWIPTTAIRRTNTSR